MLKILGFTLTGLLLVLIVAPGAIIVAEGLPGLATSLKDPEIVFAVRLSLVTSLISTALCLVTGFPVAYTLARCHLPGRRFLNSLLRLPLSLPPLVSGLGLLLLFGTTPVGRALAALGLEIVFEVSGIILAQFVVNAPALITVLRAGLEEIDPRLEAVARTLGCSHVQAFSRVTLPLLAPSLVAGLVLTWGKALGEFGAVLLVAGATRFKTETLPLAVYLNMATGDLEAALAAATILIIMSLVTLLLLEKAGGNLGGRVKGL